MSLVVISANIQLGELNCFPKSDYNTRFEARTVRKIYNHPRPKTRDG